MLREGIEENWSGRLDSNQRPSAPKADALPGCATSRRQNRGLKYKRNIANRQRNTGIAGCRRTGPSCYESSSPAVFISAINARRAWPRWLIRFFSSVESSAIVFPREGT